MDNAIAPVTFFNFCSLDTELRKRWFEETIINRKLYFRSREQLNDPVELRPKIVFEGTSKQIRTFVRNLIRERWPSKLSPADRLLEENKLIYRYRNTPAIVESTLHEILDRVGLFCVSESGSEPLLWAHYADGHRGVAVEFKSNSGLFLAAQPIVYSADVPVINRLIDSPSTILEKSILTKNEAWNYEREWRIVARWRDDERIQRYIDQHNPTSELEMFMRNQHGPGHYGIPEGAIAGVILGARVSPEAESWIRSVVDRSELQIQIRKAIVSRSGAVSIDG